MKKRNLFFSALLTGSMFLAPLMDAQAQRTSYFYKDEHSARTITPLPESQGLYVATETVLGARRDYAISIGVYNHDGTLFAPVYLYDQEKVDDRNVTVVALDKENFMIAAYYKDVGSSIVKVRLILADIYGNINGDQVFCSIDDKFNSLYAIDAIYDRNMKQFVVCGTAVHDEEHNPRDSKVAFVFTTDTKLNFQRMAFYDSPTKDNDYDIANRIIISNATDNGYYITGSENIRKEDGRFRMGMRNMLIDSRSLNYRWTLPLSIADLPESDVNSVDMVEMTDPKTLRPIFMTLANYTANEERLSNWGMMRIDPFSGNPLTGIIENNPIPGGYSHNITRGIKETEVVVTGMEYPNQKCEVRYGGDADPFFGLYNISTVSASVVYKYDYLTVIGNATYWNTGDFYAPQYTYPVPAYLNRFTARERIGDDFGMLTAIYDPARNYLNTEFIFLGPYGENNCDMSKCNAELQRMKLAKWEPGKFIEMDLRKCEGKGKIDRYDYYGYDNCEHGYYRPTGVENMEDAQVSVYPNPASTELSIELGGLGQSKVAIDMYDINGRMIANILNGTAKGKVTYRIPASLANGIYYLKVTPEGKAGTTYKVSVQR